MDPKYKELLAARLRDLTATKRVQVFIGAPLSDRERQEYEDTVVEAGASVVDETTKANVIFTTSWPFLEMPGVIIACAKGNDVHMLGDPKTLRS